jgi:hypothetical protein
MNAKKATGGFVFPVATHLVLEDVDKDDVEICLKDAALKGAVR